MAYSSKTRRRRNLFRHGVLIVLSAWSMLPIALLLIKAGLSGENGAFSANEVKNVLLLSDTFHTAFRNSMLYAVGITVGQTLLGILMAFVFSKFQFRMREFLFYLCLLFMMLPTQTMLVQIYSAEDRLGLVDTYAGVVLPQISLPLGVLFLRQYFIRVPNSITEAAVIDGASSIGCLCRILLPIGKNGFFLLLFLSFIDSYNMYEIPLIIIRDSDKVPMSVLIRAVVEKYPDEIIVPAILYMIPSILVFFILKDSIISGMVYDE